MPIADTTRAVVLAAAVWLVAFQPAAAQPGSAGPAGLPFYVPPDPLPGSQHGDVIWTRAAEPDIALPSAGRNLLLLYRSEGLDGGPIAVSGTLAVPPGSPPAGGWPMITWTHGTTGIAPACAPSLDRPGGSEHPYLGPIRTWLDAYVKKGYAVAFSDFQGLGVASGTTKGIHPFLQGEIEARGAVDIMRAARQVEPGIGTRYLAIGHSQGGQADLFTAFHGPAYAPELTLLGNVAFAPGSDVGGRITEMTTATEPSVALVYVIYFLQSVASNHPGIDLARILTPAAMANLTQTRLECATTTLTRGYWATAVPKDQFLPGADLSAVLSLAAANDPGVLRISGPTLVLQGGKDVTVLPRTTDAVARNLCRNGTPVDYRVYPDADHESVVQQGTSAAAAWVDARLTGAAAASNCDALPVAAAGR